MCAPLINPVHTTHASKRGSWNGESGARWGAGLPGERGLPSPLPERGSRLPARSPGWEPDPLPPGSWLPAQLPSSPPRGAAPRPGELAPRIGELDPLGGSCQIPTEGIQDPRAGIQRGANSPLGGELAPPGSWELPSGEPHWKSGSQAPRGELDPRFLASSPPSSPASSPAPRFGELGEIRR